MGFGLTKPGCECAVRSVFAVIRLQYTIVNHVSRLYKARGWCDSFERDNHGFYSWRGRRNQLGMVEISEVALSLLIHMSLYT